jgi:hypothetical protein
VFKQYNNNIYTKKKKQKVDSIRSITTIMSLSTEKDAITLFSYKKRQSTSKKRKREREILF